MSDFRSAFFALVRAIDDEHILIPEITHIIAQYVIDVGPFAIEAMSGYLSSDNYNHYYFVTITPVIKRRNRRIALTLYHSWLHTMIVRIVQPPAIMAALFASGPHHVGDCIQRCGNGRGPSAATCTEFGRLIVESYAAARQKLIDTMPIYAR
jgi:hypothetical protein